MGKIKELYMEIVHMYDGEIPGNLTIAEAQRIVEQEKYERNGKDRDQTGLQHSKPKNS
jgi:hypothetical protein